MPSITLYHATYSTFNTYGGIPIGVLRKICSTELYENCANVDEVLAFFDCLDDESKNKNILDNLIVAFKKDPEATHALLNSEIFNSRNEVLQMLSDERFDGNKVREVLNRINLWWTLQENDMVYKASYLNTTGKFSCVFNPQDIKLAFYVHTGCCAPHNESDQQKRTFLENVGLFQFLLEAAIKARYESVFSIIKDTKFEHLADGTFIFKVRNKMSHYLSNLLIFEGNLFSDINNNFRLRMESALRMLCYKSFCVLTPEKQWRTIFGIKFTELFVAQKYQQITQESLAKIQDLTIEDLSAIPETEEIEEFLRKKGITNSDDLSLLTKLIEDGIHIVNTIGERISLKKDMIQTISDAFADFPNFFPKRTPPSLLDLCKTNIIKSSLTEQISC